MTLRRYDAQQLRRFLEALDDHLARGYTLVVIGGSALALGHGVATVTSDIDTYQSAAHVLADAAERARQQLGLRIPIADASIAQLPPGYDERLVRILPNLRHLELWTAEVHDLAASKLLRGNDHDRQQLRMLHERTRLDLDTLSSRFEDLLAVHIGDPREPRWSLYHFVEEVWGELAALGLRPQ